MAPREATFSQDAVLSAAVSLVREEGWDALTARSLARRLRASVAPLYSAFGSMEGLQKEVLKEARRRLTETTKREYAESSFLNVGVGMAVFARDETRLFRALFLTLHPDPEILEGFDESILETMKSDGFLRLLPEASLRRLLDNLWLYTLGLAASIIYGRAEDPSTDGIIRSLKNAGNMMIFGEFSGLANCESPDGEEAWRRLLAEKKIAIPQDKETGRRPEKENP